MLCIWLSPAPSSSSLPCPDCDVWAPSVLMASPSSDVWSETDFGDWQLSSFKLSFLSFSEADMEKRDAMTRTLKSTAYAAKKEPSSK